MEQLELPMMDNPQQQTEVKHLSTITPEKLLELEGQIRAMVKTGQARVKGTLVSSLPWTEEMELAAAATILRNVRDYLLTGESAYDETPF